MSDRNAGRIGITLVRLLAIFLLELFQTTELFFSVKPRLIHRYSSRNTIHPTSQRINSYTQKSSVHATCMEQKSNPFKPSPIDIARPPRERFRVSIGLRSADSFVPLIETCSRRPANLTCRIFETAADSRRSSRNSDSASISIAARRDSRIKMLLPVRFIAGTRGLMRRRGESGRDGVAGVTTEPDRQ